MLKNKTFSRAALPQRLAALSNGGAWRRLPADSSLCLVEGKIRGCKVLLVASNPAETMDRFGIDECADFRWALQRGRATGVPLLLLLGSTGALPVKSHEVQSALRSLLREMLDARLAELPMLAVLGRTISGTAGMLASAAHERIYSQYPLRTMSGPRQRLAAQAGIPDKVKDFSATAIGHADQLIADDLDAHADAVGAWLARPFAASVTAETLLQERRHLSQQLSAAAPRVTDGPVLDGDTLFCLLSRPFGAADAIAVAELAEIACKHGRDKPLTIAVGCDGQDRSSQHDEDPDLAQYLIHMALTLRRLARAGWQLRLTVKSGIAANLYMALGAAASTVEIVLDAVICISSSAYPSAMFGSPAEARIGMGAVM